MSWHSTNHLKGFYMFSHSQAKIAEKFANTLSSYDQSAEQHNEAADAYPPVADDPSYDADDEYESDDKTPRINHKPLPSSSKVSFRNKIKSAYWPTKISPQALAISPQALAEVILENISTTQDAITLSIFIKKILFLDDDRNGKKIYQPLFVRGLWDALSSKTMTRDDQVNYLCFIQKILNPAQMNHYRNRLTLFTSSQQPLANAAPALESSAVLNEYSPDLAKGNP